MQNWLQDKPTALVIGLVLFVLMSVVASHVRILSMKQRLVNCLMTTQTQKMRVLMLPALAMTLKLMNLPDTSALSW